MGVVIQLFGDRDDSVLEARRQTFEALATRIADEGLGWGLIPGREYATVRIEMPLSDLDELLGGDL